MFCRFMLYIYVVNTRQLMNVRQLSLHVNSTVTTQISHIAPMLKKQIHLIACYPFLKFDATVISSRVQYCRLSAHKKYLLNKTHLFVLTAQ